MKLALLDLTQSLELERDGENFDIVVPEIEDAVEQYMGSILPPDNVYDHAVAFKPQIKEQEFLLESQKKMLKVARAGISAPATATAITIIPVMANIRIFLSATS